MEVILSVLVGCIAGYLISTAIHKRIVTHQLVGKLKVVWDKVEHQPYMFMELANPDITDITSRKYITLKVDDEIKFSQK